MQEGQMRKGRVKSKPVICKSCAAASLKPARGTNRWAGKRPLWRKERERKKKRDWMEPPLPADLIQLSSHVNLQALRQLSAQAGPAAVARWFTLALTTALLSPLCPPPNTYQEI